MFNFDRFFDQLVGFGGLVADDEAAADGVEILGVDILLAGAKSGNYLVNVLALGAARRLGRAVVGRSRLHGWARCLGRFGLGRRFGTFV